MDLIIELGTAADGSPNTIAAIMQAVSSNGNFNVDPFFDVSYISNIGSSGIDGFTVDSFFDIEYRTSGWDTVMVSLSLSAIFGDPDFAELALDAVRAAVTKAGGHTHYGHVTVLK